MIRSLTIMIAITCLGCNTSSVEEGEWAGSSGWGDDDVVEFTYEVSDTTERYDLVASIDHSTAFKFQNLYVEIGNITPGQDTLTTPVSLELADKKGNWQGNCSSSTCTATIDLKDHFYFQSVGIYTIWMRPYMRATPVEGVTRAGLALTLSEGKNR